MPTHERVGTHVRPLPLNPGAHGGPALPSCHPPSAVAWSHGASLLPLFCTSMSVPFLNRCPPLVALAMAFMLPAQLGLRLTSSQPRWVQPWLQRLLALPYRLAVTHLTHCGGVERPSPTATGTQVSQKRSARVEGLRLGCAEGGRAHKGHGCINSMARTLRAAWQSGVWQRLAPVRYPAPTLPSSTRLLNIWDVRVSQLPPSRYDNRLCFANVARHVVAACRYVLRGGTEAWAYIGCRYSTRRLWRRTGPDCMRPSSSSPFNGGCPGVPTVRALGGLGRGSAVLWDAIICIDAAPLSLSLPLH